MTFHIIQNIVNENFEKAKELIKESLNNIACRKLEEQREIISAKFFKESNIYKQGRVKVIRRRIRGGKLQRNIRRSAVKGFTIKGGKLQRISAVQKIRMSRIQKRAAIKRRAHMSSTLRKRARSLSRRKLMGIK